MHEAPRWTCDVFTPFHGGIASAIGERTSFSVGARRSVGYCPWTTGVSGSSPEKISRVRARRPFRPRRTVRPVRPSDENRTHGSGHARRRFLLYARVPSEWIPRNDRPALGTAATQFTGRYRLLLNSRHGEALPFHFGNGDTRSRSFY